MNNINHYRLVPARVNYWGEIVGNINDQKDLIDYISTHGGGSVYWGEIGGNINDQEDLQELVAGYATQSWVSSQQFATQSWVSSQGYYKPGSSETVLYTIQPTDLNPIVSTPLIIGNYVEGDYVEGVELTTGGAGLMKHYYNGGGEDYFYTFLTESNVSWYLDGYATESWVSTNFLSTTALTGYATQSWTESLIGSYDYLQKNNVTGESNQYVMNFRPSQASILLRDTVSHQLAISPISIHLHNGANSGLFITQNTFGVYMSSSIAGVIYDEDLNSPLLIVRKNEDYLKIDCGNIYTSLNGVLSSYSISDFATQSYVQGVASGLTSSITALETSVNTEFSSVYDRLSTIESNLGTALNITNQILG